MLKDRLIVVLTPVKNEAWILPLFLKATSAWADYIIVSDQGSSDGSKEIARSFPKVRLIENDALDDFDEYRMRKPLFDAAREIEGNRVLVSLDADEFLSEFEGKAWEKVMSQPKGTLIRLSCFNVCPDLKNGWRDNEADVVFVDDGRPYENSGLVHVTRSIVSEMTLSEDNLFFLHFQFVNWKRMESKHRWYQCYEHINYPEKSAIDLFRKYHWMYSDRLPVEPIRESWLNQYEKKGIDLSKVFYDDYFWWDEKILEYLERFGTEYFANLDIWGIDWKKYAKRNDKKIRVKRNIKSRLLLWYLDRTKYCFNSGKGVFYKISRHLDEFLREKMHL